ncbi:MAG TPA: sigma-54 dependent transcriptional regulator [Kofleriaceae bacterium]|nr:sigma-54 dependent transcriptional regulator [Kofleriaceae bacterium]
MSSTGSTILVVDDDAIVRASITGFLRARGFTTYEAETMQAAEHAFREHAPNLAIVDHQLPDGNGLDLIRLLHRIDDRVPILMLTGHASFDLAVQAVKVGAENFLTKPIFPAALFAVVQRVLDSYRDRRREVARSVHEVRSRFDPFAGESVVIRSLLEQAHQVLDSHTPILISGETGTGKGVLARWFHEHGPRAEEPFVDINCAGLSRELFESELFGHERGSFTGAATSKLGLLEVAHRGTAFLDEIGEIALALQPRILKVVEEKRFRRVGDVRSHTVDVRLITATNRDLARMVRDGGFRSDLYFRINTIHLVIPPLRRRPEDIPALAREVLDHLGIGRAIEITAEAMAAMQAYAWPGNLREMRNVFERAVLLSGGAARIEVGTLRFELPADQGPEPEVLTLEEMERRHIEYVVRLESGNIDRAAVRLGVSRSTLYGKLKRYRDDAAD